MIDADTTFPLTLSAELETWPLAIPFRTTAHTVTAIQVVRVQLSGCGHAGEGEAAGVFYRENPEQVMSLLGAVRDRVEKGITREALQSLLPAGGARNALDCALWDLESKIVGRAAWELAGVQTRRKLLTTFTCGADSPEGMAERALQYRDARAIKIKLTGEPVDADRVRAVREAVPAAWLAVDANQGFSRASLETLMPVLEAASVHLIEQPFPVGKEAWHDGLTSSIPMAADETVQGIDDMDALIGRFQVANIKLDKCGGLTEGLAMARRAQELGLEAMVGNMLGTSLAMAPAFIVGQLCHVVDLDGPVYLSSDRDDTVRYVDGYLSCDTLRWGQPHV